MLQIRAPASIRCLPDFYKAETALSIFVTQSDVCSVHFSPIPLSLLPPHLPRKLLNQLSDMTSTMEPCVIHHAPAGRESTKKAPVKKVARYLATQFTIVGPRQAMWNSRWQTLSRGLVMSNFPKKVCCHIAVGCGEAQR